ncbi:ABC transporter substrate-binding protein [Lutibacter sp.]
MKTIKDQLNRTLTIEHSPTRIISLVPSQTELLYDMALEKELIGITKFCVHPFHLKATKEIVGGTKKVNFDKIKNLNPDFILCNKEENTLEMIQELETIAPTYVSDIHNLTAAKELIFDLGQLLNRRTEATAILAKIDFKLSDFKQFMKDRPFKKVAYFIWANPWMAVGKNNFINEMLLLNKFENIYADRDRYPEVDIQRIRHEGDPEVVFLSSEPYHFSDEHAFEIGTYANRSITVFADGEMFSWFGSRTIKAFDYFKELHKRLESSF